MANVDISNGTCYRAQYAETAGDFIPCGNVAFGNWPCCLPGDVCLGFEGANACYNAAGQYLILTPLRPPSVYLSLYVVSTSSCWLVEGLELTFWKPCTAGDTYIAGCSDVDYVDKTCPQKLGFDDQEWVGIQHCNEQGDGIWDWGGCKLDPANSTSVSRLANNQCDPYCSTTLWVGGSSIAAYAVSGFIFLTLSPLLDLRYLPSLLLWCND